MAVLEYLTSIFNADTEDFKKGYNEVQKSNKDAAEAMKKTEDQGKKTTLSLKELAKSVAGYFSAAVTANKVIGMVTESAAQTVQIKDFADSVGMAVEEVDALSKSVMSLGGTRQGAEATLSTINGNLDKIKGGAKNASDGLYKIVQQVEKMDKKKAEEYLAAVGITDRRSIDAIMKGREGLEKMMRTQRELGVVSAASAERAVKFESAIGSMRTNIETVSAGLANRLLPAFTWVAEGLEKFTRWLAANQEVVAGFFLGVAMAVTAYFLPAMISAAAATLAAISPFLLIGAAIVAAGVAFALLYDDIVNFMRGNDSMIGQIMEKYPAIGRLIQGIIDFYKKLWAIIEPIVEQWGEIMASLFSALGDGFLWLIDFFFSSLNSLIEWGESFVSIMSAPVDAVVAIFEWLWEKVSGIFGSIMGMFDSAVDGFKKVGGWLGLVDDDVASDAVQAVYGNEVPVLGVDTPPVSTAQESPSASYADQAQALSERTGLPPEALRKQLEARKQASEQSRLSGADGSMGRAVKTAQTASTQAAAAPLNSVSSKSIQNSIENDNRTDVKQEFRIDRVEVVTQATDAAGIAKQVGAELQKALADAGAGLETGIER